MEVIIFGASGLIGGYLTDYCLHHGSVSKVLIFGRRPLDLMHSKLVQYQCDYASLEMVAEKIKGDVIFNCLGTTIKDAGSEEQQYQTDCLYPVAIAKIAAKNGVKSMINVSSVGASTSGNFYLKTKYDMEVGIASAMDNNSYFLRPSLLLGNRKKLRLGERIGQLLMPVFSFIMFGAMSKYRPVHATDVAKAMLNLALLRPKTPTVLHYNEIIGFSKGSQTA